MRASTKSAKAKEDTGLMAGSREAVEAAIGASKGSRTTTWESSVRGILGKIAQWDEASQEKKTDDKAAT